LPLTIKAFETFAVMTKLSGVISVNTEPPAVIDCPVDKSCTLKLGGDGGLGGAGGWYYLQEALQ
jgi:hypothetical protein